MKMRNISFILDKKVKSTLQRVSLNKYFNSRLRFIHRKHLDKRMLIYYMNIETFICSTI